MKPAFYVNIVDNIGGIILQKKILGDTAYNAAYTVFKAALDIVGDRVLYHTIYVDERGFRIGENAKSHVSTKKLLKLIDKGE